MSGLTRFLDDPVFKSELEKYLLPGCPLITGEELSAFRKRIATRKSTFGPLSPGIMTILLFIVLTGVYWGFVAGIFLKGKSYKDEKEKELTYTELITIYIATVIPLCLLFYAFNIYTHGKKEYQLHYPHDTWWGGKFWGAAVFIVLVLVLIGIIRIQELKDSPISTVWATISFVMVVVIGAVIGLLASVLIQCKLTASKDYKHKFDCVEAQLRAANKLILERAAKQQKEAKDTLSRTSAILKHGQGLQNIEKIAESQEGISKGTDAKEYQSASRDIHSGSEGMNASQVPTFSTFDSTPLSRVEQQTNKLLADLEASRR